MLERIRDTDISWHLLRTRNETHLAYLMTTTLERFVAYPLGHLRNLRILQARVATRTSSLSLVFPYGILWYSDVFCIHIFILRGRFPSGGRWQF